jgi:hypothetical protein
LPTLTVQPATCGGADTLLGQTACEDAAGTCDAGVHTTRDACEASNGGAGVYTPAVRLSPPTRTTPCVATGGRGLWR